MKKKKKKIPMKQGVPSQFLNSCSYFVKKDQKTSILKLNKHKIIRALKKDDLLHASYLTKREKFKLPFSCVSRWLTAVTIYRRGRGKNK
jgi:hypothetical protein